MEIVVFSGFSKKLNSTKRPTGGTTLNVKLKQPCSIMKPQFLISGFNTSWNYIQWGSRYYYVDDIIIETNDLATYSCTLDTLATYKDAIGASVQYITRSASAYDLDVVDLRYPTKAELGHKYHSLTNIHTKYNNTGTFVLGVKNGLSSTGVRFYAMNSTQFSILMRYMFSDGWLVDEDDISIALQRLIVNPMDYISSCYWYPFDISGSPETIQFGFWGGTGASGSVISDSGRLVSVTDPITLANHPQVARGRYLNALPYSEIMVDCFGFGRIPIDPNLFLDSRSMSVQIQVDVFTGVGELTVESTNGRAAKISSMVGVPIQLSQISQNLLTPIMGVINAGVDIASHNYLGAAADVGNAVLSSMPQVQTQGSVGSKVAFAKTPYVYQIFYKITDEDLSSQGRPLMSPRTISSLTGYIECANVELDTVGTENEKEIIKNFMESGFYYE